MKKICLSIIGVALSTSLLSTAYAGVCNFYPGLTICGAGTYNNPIKVVSPMTTNSTTITRTVTVTGPLEITNQSDLEQPVSLTGFLNIIDSAIQGAVTITGVINATNAQFNSTVSGIGVINATNSQFESSVTITTNILNFSSSSAPNITINPGSSAQAGSKACIMQGSKVNAIVFTSGNNNDVYIDSTSTVGSILGGQRVLSSTCPE